MSKLYCTLSIKQLNLGPGAQSMCLWSAANESPTCTCMFRVKQKDSQNIWFVCVSKLMVSEHA